MENKIKINGVTIKVDTIPMWRNTVTVRFENGDYCDINIKTLNDSAWYLSTNENVELKNQFKEDLKNGKITIDKIKIEF